MRNAKSYEQGLVEARAEFIDLAYHLIKDEALSNSDFSGGSFTLRMLFGEKKEKPKQSNQYHRNLLNSYNNLPLGNLRLDHHTVLIELICGHNETIAFLTSARGDINVINLPKLGLRSVQDRLVTFDNGKLNDGWLANYIKFLASQRPNSTVISNDPIQDFLLGPLDSMLMWLDESFAQPVRDAIAKLDNDSKTIEKIVLIPGAPLGFIPLHGAFHYQKQQREYLLDDFSVSYCPNDALLRLEWKNYKHASNSRPFLISFMDQKTTTFFMELEVLWATNILRAQKSYAIKFEQAPSGKDWKEWYKVIDPATHLLVSSHGISDLKRPLLNSGFFLGEDRSSASAGMLIEMLKDFNLGGGSPKPSINLIDLAKLPLSNCRFAFLGACESAMSTSLPTADNGLSPATALLLSGVKNVVASMWLANDIANSLLFKEVFTNIGNGFSCDTALRTAQKKLRNITWLEIRDEINSAVNMNIASKVTGLDLDDSKLHMNKPFEHPWFWVGYQSWISQT